VVRLLVSDQRVHVNRVNKKEHTPLWIACHEEHFEVAKLLLASGRDIDAKKAPPLEKTTPAQEARKRNNPEVARLIERFERSPEDVAAELRREIGITSLLPPSLPSFSLSFFWLS